MASVVKAVKIVILGVGGRLGAALFREYQRDHTVIGFNHNQLDLSLDHAMTALLEPLDFDLLINCAALTNVDYCETHPEEAMQINGEAVRRIATLAARKKARVIHISTDYVFDGEKRTPYLETDPADPISVYGVSKKQGETALLAVSESNLVVRVSWVFGPDRPSFIDQILKCAIECETVSAIADKISVPAYTLDIARHLKPLLFENPAGGIVHLCHSGECTWQQYGQFAINCAIANGVPIRGEIVAPLAMIELKTFIASRPVYTVLSTARLTALTGESPRDWRVAVEEYVKKIKPSL